MGISTQIFDLRDLDVALPDADLVVGSDLFYERDTACALAKRVAEARRCGSEVVIGHTFRPWRDAFVDEFVANLQHSLPEEAADVQFESHPGVAAGGERHSLIVDPSSGSLPGCRVNVELLALPPRSARETTPL